MSAEIHPLRPRDAAQPAILDKRESTCRARLALLGRQLRRLDGIYVVGLRRFRDVGEVEDFLDQLMGDAE